MYVPVHVWKAADISAQSQIVQVTAIRGTTAAPFLVLLFPPTPLGFWVDGIGTGNLADYYGVLVTMIVIVPIAACTGRSLVLVRGVRFACCQFGTRAIAKTPARPLPCFCGAMLCPTSGPFESFASSLVCESWRRPHTRFTRNGVAPLLLPPTPCGADPFITMALNACCFT